MAVNTLNWAAIDADPRFQSLHARKSRFLWGLMAFSVVYYFLLPIGAAKSFANLPTNIVNFVSKCQATCKLG